MAKPHLKLVTPATIKRTVAPKRRPNADLRTREHLTEAEVERLMAAARKNRWGHRDATMVLVAYRHGLRAAELVDLRWEQVDYRAGALLPPTRSLATSYEHCGGFSVSRTLGRHSCSPRNGARPSPPQGLPA